MKTLKYLIILILLSSCAGSVKTINAPKKCNDKDHDRGIVCAPIPQYGNKII